VIIAYRPSCLKQYTSTIRQATAGSSFRGNASFPYIAFRMKAIERVLQIKRLLTYNFLVWCLLGVLSGVQRYSYALNFGHPFQWQSLIRNPLSTCLMYWAMSYLVIDLFLFSRNWNRRQFLQLHIPASLLFGLMHKLLSYISGLLLERLFLPAESLSWQELIILWEASWFDISLGVAVYWIILIVLTALHFWKQFREEHSQAVSLKNQLNEARLQSMRMQLQPHFLFNTLNNIYSLSLIKSDMTAGAILKLTELLEYLVYEASRDKVMLRTELSLINNYLDLEALRHEESLKVVKNVDVQDDDIEIAPLIILPFIENCFKHGGRGEDGVFRIRFDLVASQSE